MTDIATLGLKIDITQAAGASAALDRLSVAARAAETRAAALEKAGAAAARGAASLSKQAGLARYELINLSRQAQDVGVSLASGQSPFTVLVQQGTQMADIFASTNGSLRGFGSQFVSVITPTRILAAGIIGIGGAAIAATFSWRSFALALDDTAKRAGVTVSEMARLQAAASFKGIDNQEFSTGITRFNQQVYEAKNNMGALAELFRANGTYARDFSGAFEKVADLVRNSRDDQQRLVILQQAGLPATMEWVRLMSQGAEGVRRAKAEAVAFGGEANDKMVEAARRFDDAWNRTWTNFGLGWRGAIVGFAEWADSMIDKGRRMSLAINLAKPTDFLATAMKGESLRGGTNLTQRMADDFYKATGALTSRRGDETADPNILKNQIARYQQYIGILGELATTEQRVQAVRNVVAGARLEGVRITEAESRALQNLARVQSDSARIQEMAGIGIFDTALAQANLNRELQSAIDRGLLDPRNVNQMAAAWNAGSKRLRELADAAAMAGSALPQVTRYALDSVNTMKQLDDVIVSGFRGFESAFVSFATGTKSMKDAFKDMANGIIADFVRMTLRMQVTGPLAKLLGSTFGTGFGMGTSGTSGLDAFMYGTMHTGGVVGQSTTLGRYVHPAYFENANRFKRGGIAGLGPDEVPIIAHKNEEIIRRDDPRHRFNGGGKGDSISASFAAPTIIIQGDASEKTVSLIDAALQNYDKGSRRRVEQAISDMRRRSSSVQV